MKAPESPHEDGGLQPDYDFSKGVRGKHYDAYHQMHTLRIYQADGTIEERIMRPGSVDIAPDVRAYFPDAEAVNRALRGLIALLPQKTTEE